MDRTGPRKHSLRRFLRIHELPGEVRMLVPWALGGNRVRSGRQSPWSKAGCIGFKRRPSGEVWADSVPVSCAFSHHNLLQTNHLSHTQCRRNQAANGSNARRTQTPSPRAVSRHTLPAQAKPHSFTHTSSFESQRSFPAQPGSSLTNSRLWLGYTRSPRAKP